jgi:hypothetical protein
LLDIPPTENILSVKESEGLQKPDCDNDGIDVLDIADGLKELLRRKKMTLDALIQLSQSQLADILGIDGYVAKIICESAKSKASLVYTQE